MQHETDIGPEPVPSAALAAYIDTDRNGYKSFNYAGCTGSLLAILDGVREKLDAIGHMERKRRAEKVIEIKAYVDDWHGRHQRLQSEWDDFYPRHIEWRRKKRQAAIPRERGGPTVDDPDRPYCKPDQSCCDFVCGN